MQKINFANRAKHEFFEHFTFKLMQICHPNMHKLISKLSNRVKREFLKNFSLKFMQICHPNTYAKMLISNNYQIVHSVNLFNFSMKLMQICHPNKHKLISKLSSRAKREFFKNSSLKLM